MNARVPLPVLQLAAIALLSTAARGSVAQDVAAYDQFLADVKAGRTTITLGDMIVPVETVRLWRDRLANARKPTAESASQTGINKWTGGNVYYAFNANVSAAYQAAFLDGAREWETFANIHFIARISQTNYIMINDGGPGLFGGNSAVGMIGGVQQLNIGSTSWNRGTIVHEIGHALGLIHEHQRSDRDSYVTIRAAVAGDGNFILIPTSTNHGAYDFLSVMHYARNTFAPVGVDNITPKAGYTQFIDIMGNNPDRLLSRGDRDGIAAMYGAGPPISTIVTNTKDSGPGSLRAAIYKAFDIVTDTPAATPTITFHIPNTDPNFSGGVFTIRPSDRMTAPGSRTTIDASTQTAFGGDTNPGGPEVVLNGALQNDPSTYGLGLRLSAANVTVKGLVINGFSTQGVLITAGATGNTVAGCYIGTNAAGNAAAANTFAGIEINGGATGNTIGGTTASARNVISGNSAQGVFIRGAGTTGNFVRGNYLGVNAAGTGPLANGFSGVEIGESASANTVGGTAAGAGNVLSGNTYQGVYLNAASGNTVAGNLIGTNAAGTSAIPNDYSGIGIFSGATANTVGPGNLISGNSNQGIYISDSGTHSNVVSGNIIGLNATGVAALPNGFSGVEIGGEAQNNVIGGTTASAGNIISGNTYQGVYLNGAGTSGNLVAGNYIGTNPAGNAAIANGADGVEIYVAPANTIGGPAPGAGNVISGNANRNVLIIAANNNVVSGNFIGLNAAGTAGFAGGGPGIQIWGGAQGNTIGGTSGGRNFISGNTDGLTISDPGTNANVIVGNSIGTTPAGTIVANSGHGISIFGGPQNNLIGGITPGTANVVSGNGGAGIAIYNSSTGNRIRGNSITGNNGLGIDFWNDGVTANDAGDADTGPNNLQNFPVLNSAVLGTGTTISWTLNSTPNSTGFRVEFFANASADGEGQTFIGADTVDTIATGNPAVTPRTTTLPAIVPAGHFITATATDSAGNTSEFSLHTVVTTTDSDSDGLPDAYEFANWPLLTTTNGSTDSDGDGMTNAQELRAGTDPRNPASVLRLGVPGIAGGDITLSLAAMLSRTYRVEFADSLDAPVPWRILADQIPGAGALIPLVDPGAAALPQRFYRATVQP